MESRAIQAFLRVLYTVNSNPQYILAKSSSQVPAFTCTDEPAYARAPLKACLAAVCDSSPELLHDPARDFSLYVLDPLEAQHLPTGLAHAPQDTSSPRGVAVALGLMSWALELNDSTNVFVTGTIIPHSPALEVVFALRETKRVPKHIFNSYPSLGPVSAPGPSQLLNPHPHTPGINWTSASQEQQTLTRSADFPELYIGPPRRARGRPEGSTSLRSKVSLQTRVSSQPGANPSEVAETQSEFKREAGRKSKHKVKSRPSRALPTYSPFICAPLTRHMTMGGPEGGATGIPTFCQQSNPFDPRQAHSYAQFYPQAQPYFHPTHNPSLGLLSAIPPNSLATDATPEQQTALLTALQGLLATNPHLLQLAAASTGISAASGEQTDDKKPNKGSNASDVPDDGDSDIVILDSSTVDTTAFCKPSSWQIAASDQDTAPSTINHESPMSSIEAPDSSPLPASTSRCEQEDAPASSQLSTPTATPKAETLNSKREMEKGDMSTSRVLYMPATPTPCRTRKRKQSEYFQGQADLSIPTSSPSPSPSMKRTSKALTARRVQTSPTGGGMPVLPPSVRLSSMLDSMRTMATSGSRRQVNSLCLSTHGHMASLSTNKSESQSITLVSCPSNSKADHPGTADTSLNDIASDAASLKRRRTLGEFMAEHEARKNAKVRKRSSSERKSEAGVYANGSQLAPLQLAKVGSTTRHTQSSPSRPLFRSDSVASSLLVSTRRPALVPDAAISNHLSSTTLAHTASSASTSTAVPTKNPLKNFVVPAWARTSTAMLPRLSEEALARQRAEQEAKKLQASSRRREAAKTKRKRLRDTERPCKESSDEDDEPVPSDAKVRALHPSSGVAPAAPLLPLPLPSLPVFASDAVEPIPSSPPQSHRQIPPSAIPSTPPRKPTSSGSARQCTPGKSGCRSLFTPSGQDSGSLFTPSTPSVTRSLGRVTFTPRSPTVLRRSGERKSPRKSVPQTPWAPGRHNGNQQTPRNSRSGRNPEFVSPNLAVRTPQIQTRMGTRAFLLPPPSPCAPQTPHMQKQVYSKVPGSSTPVVRTSGIIKQDSPSVKQIVGPDKGCEQNGILDYHSKDALLASPPTVGNGQGRSELHDITPNDDASQAEEEYSSSLPPSSPPPTSAFSSPAKHHDSDSNAAAINDDLVPDSDIPLPSAGDSDAPMGVADATWLSDDAFTASWMTDSEASAWLTETEAWLTDTEGGALLKDSAAAWFSDSDAVFGDMSSFPQSSASSWLSDGADVDTDSEFGAMGGRDGGFDAAEFERAFVTLVEGGGRVRDGSGREDDVSDRIHDPRVVTSEFWESTPALLVANAMLNDVGTAPGDGGEIVDEKAVQELFDSNIVGT